LDTHSLVITSLANTVMTRRVILVVATVTTNADIEVVQTVAVLGTV
jgi:hypothetical protein